VTNIILRGLKLPVEVIDFKENSQVTTTLKYHGKNRFYLSSNLVEALIEDGEINKGDEMVIKILSVNKFNKNGDNKE